MFQRLWSLEDADNTAHIYSRTNAVLMPKVALLHRLPIPYEELINNADTACV